MSSNKSSKDNISKEDITKIKQLLEAIETEPQAYDFLQPVDYIGLGLDDYPKIIKTPMDISTIKKNLKNNKYTSAQDVLNDIKLIWDNCKQYNIEGSEIYKLALYCEKFTKKQIDKLFKPTPASAQVQAPNVGSNTGSATKNLKSREKTYPSSSVNNINLSSNFAEPVKETKKENEEENQDIDPHNAELSVQERLVLLERVKKLSNDGLASLVRLIQKECPNSIEDLDSEKLQIRLDIVDKRTHDQMNQLIDTFLRVKDTIKKI